MAQKDNILQELNELQSRLAGVGFENVYTVPGDYFDGLAGQVLSRIRAMETENASEELRFLSPLLSSLSKEMPYAVPSGFFTEQEQQILKAVKSTSNELTSAEELKELSPLLSSLKKESPYSVPAGYFEKLDAKIPDKVNKPAKVVSLTKQNWFRYAAAAVVIGVIAIGGLLVFNRNATTSADPEAMVKTMMKKVSDDDINRFVEMTEEESAVANEQSPVIAQADVRDKNEVKELIKDVSEKDIQSFIDDAQSIETDDGEDALMN